MDDATTWPEAIYEPHRPFSFAASIRELIAYREVAWSFAMRRIRARYKQAVFGFLWAVVQPLAFLVLFVAFLGKGQQSAGSYTAGTFAALVAWQYFSSAITGAGASIIGEAGLLRKVYFPRECVVLGGIGSFLPDLLINMLCLFVVAPIFDAEVGLTWLFVPLLAILVVFVSVSVAIPLAGLTVYYRDLLYAVPFLVQLWLFGSPIAYTIDRVPDRWQWLYALANPMAGPLVGFRDVVARNAAPDWELLGFSMLSSTVVLLVGYRWFKGLERDFAEVV